MKQLTLLTVLLFTFAALPAQDMNAQPFLEKAVLLLDEEQFEAALAEIGFAIEIEPENASFYRLQAQILEMLDSREEAITAWELCLKYTEDEELIDEAEHHLKALSD